MAYARTSEALGVDWAAVSSGAGMALDVIGQYTKAKSQAKAQAEVAAAQAKAEMQAQAEQQRRAAAQGQTTTYLLVGGAVLAAGVLVLVLTRK
jgi:hypothetical protein